ncbi:MULTISPECIES: MarR family winged helix-turn-helix transcriptional regulator [Sphingomonas]|uniref:MarR family winged helix-turn-helix transcriptional regulator n=1 Tax=Sphingomonas TaxID=13687 RepID=UPI000DEFA86E|nr:MULTISPECIES: MarR family transcriptional regulator [Sphingomonas]
MEELPWEIGETSLALRRAFDRKASSLGVTRAQWRVLARLGREPGLRQVELAERMDVEPITLCRIVDRLEDGGLVERQRDPTDRRAWRLFLTAKAEPTVERLHSLAADMATDAFAGLDQSTIAAVRAALARVRENVSASPKGRATA